MIALCVVESTLAVALGGSIAAQKPGGLDVSLRTTLLLGIVCQDDGSAMTDDQQVLLKLWALGRPHLLRRSGSVQPAATWRPAACLLQHSRSMVRGCPDCPLVGQMGIP